MRRNTTQRNKSKTSYCLAALMVFMTEAGASMPTNPQILQIVQQFPDLDPNQLAHMKKADIAGTNLVAAILAQRDHLATPEQLHLLESMVVAAQSQNPAVQLLLPLTNALIRTCDKSKQHDYSLASQSPIEFYNLTKFVYENAQALEEAVATEPNLRAFIAEFCWHISANAPPPPADPESPSNEGGPGGQDGTPPPGDLPVVTPPAFTAPASVSPDPPAFTAPVPPDPQVAVPDEWDEASSRWGVDPELEMDFQDHPCKDFGEYFASYYKDDNESFKNNTRWKNNYQEYLDSMNHPEDAPIPENEVKRRRVMFVNGLNLFGPGTREQRLAYEVHQLLKSNGVSHEIGNGMFGSKVIYITQTSFLNF
ncbi:MAG: hypothetical protein LBF65_00960 [Holosporales bacterium]|nr:hypothetical protein [Holosporales bacterium]